MCALPISSFARAGPGWLQPGVSVRKARPLSLPCGTRHVHHVKRGIRSGQAVAGKIACRERPDFSTVWQLTMVIREETRE